MKKLLAALAMTIVLSAGAANAAVVYVGSWLPDDGPNWGSNPLAYSGVGAAQLLFGPGTYHISTVDSDPNNINNMAWYNIIGVGSQIFAENYFRGTEGTTHYQDVYVYDPAIDTVSAYVADFYSAGRNYAFRITDVPEPMSLALLGTGLLGTGAAIRRRRS